MIIDFQKNNHWMLFASTFWLVFSSLLNSQVVVDGLGAFVLFGNYDENILFVELQKAKLGE